jgi:hypothetical protein
MEWGTRTYCSSMEASSGSANLTKFLVTLIFGGTRQSILTSSEKPKDTHRNNPRTGSNPTLIESLNQWRLSFSTHTNCISFGSVSMMTDTMSWYP